MLKLNQMVYIDTVNEYVHPCISRKLFWGNTHNADPNFCDFKLSTPVGRIRSYTEYFNGSIKYGVEVICPVEKRRYLGESIVEQFPAQYIRPINVTDELEEYYSSMPIQEFDTYVFKYSLGSWVKHIVDTDWMGMIYGRTLDSNNCSRYKVRINGGRTIDEYEIMFNKCNPPM